MSNIATMANRLRGSYQHQHDTRQARDRSMYVLGYLQSAHSFDIKPMRTQSQTLRANTRAREQIYVALRTYERVWIYAQCVPSNRTSVCFYFCRTYKCPRLYPYSPHWMAQISYVNLLNEKQDRSIIEDMRSWNTLYAHKAHVVPNPAQFQSHLGLNQHMHRKRIIVRSYITLLKMINDTSFASTPLLRGCELFVRA